MTPEQEQHDPLVPYTSSTWRKSPDGEVSLPEIAYIFNWHEKKILLGKQKLATSPKAHFDGVIEVQNWIPQ